MELVCNDGDAILGGLAGAGFRYSGYRMRPMRGTYIASRRPAAQPGKYLDPGGQAGLSNFSNEDVLAYVLAPLADARLPSVDRDSAKVHTYLLKHRQRGVVDWLHYNDRIIVTSGQKCCKITKWIIL